MPKKPFRDLTGQRFGRLLVYSYANRNKYGNHQWFCICDCGTAKLVPDYCMIYGSTKSCGCYRVEHGRMVAKKGNTAVKVKHDLGKSPEYKIWASMKARCNTTHTKPHKDYALRGIAVCPRWRDSFETFYKDMGARPSESHTIERIDNNQGYSPENCCWVPAHEQAKNKRNNVFLTHNGERRHLAEWARIFSIGVGTLWSRLDRGWSEHDALTTPLKIRRNP